MILAEPAFHTLITYVYQIGDTMEHWYLACHKFGRHNAFKAQMLLSDMGVTVFIPQICNRVPRLDRPGHFKKIIEPLFPGYLFVCFDYEIHHSSKVAATPGISHFVSFGGKIKPLHDTIVDDIMRWTLVIDHEITINNRGSTQANIPCFSRDKNICGQHLLQHEIKRIIEEPHGETRNILFCNFIKSNSKNKVG